MGNKKRDLQKKINMMFPVFMEQSFPGYRMRSFFYRYQEQRKPGGIKARTFGDGGGAGNVLLGVQKKNSECSCEDLEERLNRITILSTKAAQPV